MDYNFDKITNRQNTDAIKWDPMAQQNDFGAKNILPFGIADMDFPVAPAIQSALQKRLDNGVFGYSEGTDYNEALQNWMKQQHNWNIPSEWITNTNGIVLAINLAIQAFCQAGDQVLIQEPVYYPFASSARNNGCQVVSNDLINHDGHYEIDFDDFEKKAADPKTTLFILCSPHNPIGRIWTSEELHHMVKICAKYHVYVIADEIHSDLTMPNEKFINTAVAAKEWQDNVMTCLSESKAFNLAGIKISYIVISDPHMRQLFRRSVDRSFAVDLNPFAMAATVAAYRDSEDWLK
ncbi:Aspartate aminotransferase [Pediococcus damnosus]|uniref:cysteine-S-conjugate beta-lyase n=1 Tax=Pediococcus damnosus TaxID=51663 RepID=A0ABN4NB14_9LACO|nr:aminotransferase class I/II-fold pyridoxal phosphate-dependent enzyme [Pediococcus damnosus]AMV67810.1 Aspartate aminotransferase [Pediococcus damnosus]KRN53863.1 hypothetical protein IV84_GL001184 [Pediococcus damnosus]PIO81702.1 hypothetical protein BSQ38_08705 [Pediococcus damnosus]PIO84741.1 hypothetical protein BSQ37_01720 [Pediococcus damnosus]PJE48770.1 cystathionine beta-lyase [Pediococcus damnosus]